MVVRGALLVVFVLVAFVLWLKPAPVAPAAIAHNVTRTPALLARAWRLPVAATYGQHVTFQSNPSRCGPATVANVLRSLGETATTEDQVLAGTGFCWTGFCIKGLTLTQLAEVARQRTRRRVRVLNHLTPESFREAMRRSNDPRTRYTVNFARKRIFGGGTGHHSPIGGYLEAEDLVFVLDTNRDYQPWLIERPRLFDALNTFDGDAKRGLLLFE